MSSIRFTFYERRGLGAYAAGKLEKAESWFRKMELLEPDSLKVLRNLGVVLLARGRAEEAEVYLRKDPSRALGYFRKALALVDQPSLVRNAELARKALERDVGKGRTT